MGDELPYGCTVVIEQWEESDDRARISACVIVERETHRPILLGAKGMHMKRIASEARVDIAELLEKSVHLEVYIKVKKVGLTAKVACVNSATNSAHLVMVS